MIKKTLTFICGLGSAIILNAQITGNGWYYSPAKNYGYTSGILYGGASVPIANNTKFITTPGHVYYIGNNSKVCDYVFNGTSWQGGGQLEWDWAFVNPSVPLVNDAEDIFWVGTDNKVYKTVWNSGWSSTLVNASQVKLCDPGFPIAFGQNNNANKKILYVCANTNKICSFSKSGSLWNYDGELNNDPNSQAVRGGSQIIYDGQGHVFFIGASTNKIHNYWWSGSGWYEGVLNANAVPVMSGTNMQFDGNELYYIGTDARVYRMYWNAGWQTQAISQAEAWASFLVYHNNKIYYGDFAGMIDFKIRCIEKVSGSWTGVSTVITGTDKVSQLAEINVISNPIYYEGSALNFFYSHQVSYKSSIDGRVHYAILDFYHADETQPLVWHNGVLNTNAPGFGSYHSFIGYNDDPNQKMFFYSGNNGYLNFFTRKVNNPASKVNMHLTFQQEFNAADPGLTNLNNAWNINWPWGSGSAYTYGNSFYHNDIQHNCAVNNGKVTLSTIQETGQGTQYGSADPVNDAIPWNCPSPCSTTNYNYTSQQLHTGWQNPSWSCCGPWHADQTFAQQNGYFEARLKIPRAKHAWPAFWFTSNPVEIDFECPGNGKWLFCNSYATGIYRMVAEAAVGYRYYDDYYTLAIKPTPGGVTWYLNNEEVFSTTESGYYPINPLWVYVQQVQVDGTGSWAAYPNTWPVNEVAVYPNYLTVDYVRVYQNDIQQGRTIAPANQTIPSTQMAAAPVSKTAYLAIQNKDIEVTAYPNPVQRDGKLSVDLGKVYGKVIIEIENNLGQVVHTINYAGISSTDIDLSQNQAGIYFIKITCDDKKSVVKKIMKM